MGFGANFGSFASGLSQGINNGITLIQARDAARKRRSEREADETFKAELKGVFGQQGGAGGAPGADATVGNVGTSAATGGDAYEKLTSEINGRFNALETTLQNRQSLEDAAYVAYADMGEKYFPHLLNESMMGEGGWNNLDMGTKRREVFMQGEALAAFNKATGLDAEDIVVNKGNGGLTTWRRGDGDAEGAVGSYPTIMDAETFAAMRGRVGSGGGYDFSTGRYLGQEDYDLSRTAWMRDHGEGYFTGMTAREANADYAEWRKERIADQRYAEAMGLKLSEIQYGRMRDRQKDAETKASQEQAEAEKQKIHDALVQQFIKDGLSDEDAERRATLEMGGFGTSARRGRGTSGAGNFTGDGEGGEGAPAPQKPLTPSETNANLRYSESVLYGSGDSEKGGGMEAKFFNVTTDANGNKTRTLKPGVKQEAVIEFLNMENDYLRRQADYMAYQSNAAIVERRNGAPAPAGGGGQTLGQKWGWAALATKEEKKKAGQGE